MQITEEDSLDGSVFFNLELNSLTFARHFMLISWKDPQRRGKLNREKFSVEGGMNRSSLFWFGSNLLSAFLLQVDSKDLGSQLTTNLCINCSLKYSISVGRESISTFLNSGSVCELYSERVNMQTAIFCLRNNLFN